VIKILSIIGIALLIILLSSCNTVSDEIFGVSEPDSLGFQTVSSNGITLSYKIDTVDLHCVLTASTTGWIAVGFNPSNMMADANFIIGFVDDRSVEMRDDWGVSNTGHQSDISLGGVNNITVISGMEVEGITELEFKIPLDSQDIYDRILEENGTYPVILAKGSSDDFDSYHNAVGFSEIVLGAGPRD
jgi:hypothetical protein